MAVACIIAMLICAGGVQKGIEKITKFMMTALLIIMVVLAVFAVLQPGAEAGLEFYLKPDFSKVFSS